MLLEYHKIWNEIIHLNENTGNGNMTEDNINMNNHQSLATKHFDKNNRENGIDDYSKVFARLNNYDIYNQHKTSAAAGVDHLNHDEKPTNKMHRRVQSLPSEASIAEFLSNTNNHCIDISSKSRTRPSSPTSQYHAEEEEETKGKDKKSVSYKKRMKSVINQSSIKKISNKLKLNMPSHPLSLSKHDHDDSSLSSQDNKKQGTDWNSAHTNNDADKVENDNIILINIVWKRKSSTMGGLSDIYTHYTSASHPTNSPTNISHDNNNSNAHSYSTNLWEKRLLVLTKDGRLSYYHMPKNYDGNNMTIDSSLLNICRDNSSNSGKTLHVVHDRAIVSARSSSSHGNPTPFRIVVRTFKQMEFSTKTSVASLLHSSHDHKWQFCFEHYSEQIKWLSTVSHIIINNSVIHNKNKNIYFKKEELSTPSSFSQNTAVPPIVQSDNTHNYDEFKEIDNYGKNTPDSCKDATIDQHSLNNSKRSISSLHSYIPTALKQQPFQQKSSLWSYFAQQQLGVIASGLLFLLWNLSFFHLYKLATMFPTNTSSCVYLVLTHIFISYGLFAILYYKDNESPKKGIESCKSIQLSPSVHTHFTSNQELNCAVDHGKSNVENNHPDAVVSTNKTVPVTSPSTADGSYDRNKYKPKAGSTTIRVVDPKDAKMYSDKFLTWKPLVGLEENNDILLRGSNYFETKKKQPCIGQIYSLQEVDSFESTGFIPNVSSRVELPPFEQHQCNNRYTAPDQLVISLTIPSKVPKLGLSSSNEKEKGITITMYFVLKEWARKILNQHYANKYMNSTSDTEIGYVDGSIHHEDKDNQMSDNEETCFSNDTPLERVNAVLLWERWCQRASSDPKEQARFKVIVNSPNLRSLGVPSWICKYNGKPFLIKRSGVTGHLFKHSSNNLIEYDVTLLPFPYLFKQAMSYLKDHYFKQLLINFAFVIEGRDNSELPECLIGDALQLCYPDTDKLISEHSFFSGDYTSAPRLKKLEENAIRWSESTNTSFNKKDDDDLHSHVFKTAKGISKLASNDSSCCVENNCCSESFSLNKKGTEWNNKSGPCIIPRTNIVNEKTSLLHKTQSQS